MIVTCPACRSRYRCGDRSEPGATAHCSACNERFPLQAQRKSYRVQQGGSTLSATMEMTAVQLSGNAPGVDEQGSGADPLLEGRPPETRIDLQFGRGGALPTVDIPVPEPVQAEPLEMGPAPDEVEIPAVESPSVESEKGRSRMPQTVGELLVAMVPASLGGVVAYYFAGLYGRPPVLGAVVGTVAGLLFGWACLLWITRDD